MKRKILLLVLAMLLVLSIVVLANDVKYDFRKTNWGISKEQVKASEGREPDFKDDNGLWYYVRIGTKDFACSYQFLEDKLHRGVYIFTGKHTNDNLYVNDYEELKKTLIKKYGEPRVDEKKWKNDLFKDYKSSWGMAISMGHLEYWTFWETPNTGISLMLTGDNYKIILTLHYVSRELEEWVKQIKAEEAKDDF